MCDLPFCFSFMLVCLDLMYNWVGFGVLFLNSRQYMNLINYRVMYLGRKFVQYTNTRVMYLSKKYFQYAITRVTNTRVMYLGTKCFQYTITRACNVNTRLHESCINSRTHVFVYWLAKGSLVTVASFLVFYLCG